MKTRCAVLLAAVLCGCDSEKPAPAAAPRGSSVVLSPSDAPQTATWEQVRVTVPGGLLRESRKLTIRPVDDPAPPNRDGIRQAAVYDISIEGLDRFDQDLVLEFPWNGEPAWVESYEPESGVWFPERSTVDPERKTITVRTRHLSAYAVLNPQGGGDYKLWVAEEEAREPLLVIHYNDKEVRGLTRVFRDETLGFELKKLENDSLPGYVAKVAEFAREALAAYRKHGFEPYVKPLRLYVGGPKRIASSYHNEWTGNISINTTADTLETLRYVVSHEIFHSVQRNFYWPQAFPFRRGWIEATAEYAACRIAMPDYRYMGKLDKGYRRKVLATYLTKDLTYFRARPAEEGTDPWANHEYAAAYFVDHVCRTGAARSGTSPSQYFATMFRSAAAGGDWDGLEAILTGKDSLPRQYADFAAHYLLEPASPMYFVEENDQISYRTGSVTPAALDARLSLVEDGKPQTHTFSFGEKLTSRVIQARVEAPKEDTWFASVEPDGELPEGVFLTVGILKSDDRARGCEYHRLEKPRIFPLKRDDALYVVASSSAAQAGVSVILAALPLQATPLQSSAKISLTPPPWGKAGCTLTLGVEGNLVCPAGMKRTVSETTEYTNYPHLKILSPSFLPPTELQVTVDYSLSKGVTYRHEDIFEFGSGYVEMRIDNPRLKISGAGIDEEVDGLTCSVRVPLPKGRSPQVHVSLVLDVRADFFQYVKDGDPKSVKTDSAKMTFLVTDVHVGGF